MAYPYSRDTWGEPKSPTAGFTAGFFVHSNPNSPRVVRASPVPSESARVQWTDSDPQTEWVPRGHGTPYLSEPQSLEQSIIPSPMEMTFSAPDDGSPTTPDDDDGDDDDVQVAGVQTGKKAENPEIPLGVVNSRDTGFIIGNRRTSSVSVSASAATAPIYPSMSRDSLQCNLRERDCPGCIQHPFKLCGSDKIPGKDELFCTKCIEHGKTMLPEHRNGNSSAPFDHFCAHHVSLLFPDYCKLPDSALHVLWRSHVVTLVTRLSMHLDSMMVPLAEQLRLQSQRFMPTDAHTGHLDIIQQMKRFTLQYFGSLIQETDRNQASNTVVCAYRTALIYYLRLLPVIMGFPVQYHPVYKSVFNLIGCSFSTAYLGMYWDCWDRWRSELRPGVLALYMG
jgi:hypothetical protein